MFYYHFFDYMVLGLPPIATLLFLAKYYQLRGKPTRPKVREYLIPICVIEVVIIIAALLSEPR